MALRAGIKGAHGAQGFSQHHADSTVQQPERLTRALVHRHAARRKSSPTSVNSIPRWLTAVLAPLAVSCSTEMGFFQMDMVCQGSSEGMKGQTDRLQ